MDWGLLSAWQGKHVGRPLRILDDVDSTNTEALRHLDLGAGATFLARHQHAGRGTQGRSWEHREGKSVALSVILELDPERTPAAAITMLGAVSACDALEASGLPTARLKWPNDVYAGDRKIAGVLVEVRPRPPLLVAVLGIGINVGQDAPDFPGPYRSPPTSLRLEGRPGAVPEVARELLRVLDERLEELRVAGPAGLVGMFARRLGVLERPVEIVTATGVLHGRALRLEADGTLILRPPGAAEVAIPGGHILRIDVAFPGGNS